MGIRYKELVGKSVGLIKKRLSVLIIVGLLAVIGNIASKDYINKKSVEKIEEALLKPIPVKEEKKVVEALTAETCAPVIEKQVKIDGGMLFKDSNFVVLDLSTFEMFKKKRIDSKRVGYYYRRAGATKEWYTIFKYESILDEHVK